MIINYYFMVYHNIYFEFSMSDHNIKAMSESEEMYLITIARLFEGGVEDPVSVSRIAGELSIQPVSANQMVHKLVEEGLVEYFPYKGVSLTPKGQAAAQQVLRGRRLWEVFLVNHLELSPGEADAMACLQAVQGEIRPFELMVGGVRSFLPRNPIVFLDIEPTAGLMAARQTLLQALGKDKHRSFVPHLTLTMRLGREGSQALLTRLRRSKWHMGHWSALVDHLWLMQRGPDDSAWRYIYRIDLTRG